MDRDEQVEFLLSNTSVMSLRLPLAERGWWVGRTSGSVSPAGDTLYVNSSSAPT